mgnify:CR=1 FL=1
MNISKTKKIILITIAILFLGVGGYKAFKTISVAYNHKQIDNIVKSDGAFDYKNFAKHLSKQVPPLIPSDMTKEQGKFIQNNVEEYSLKTGEKLAEDKRYSNEEKAYMTQIVAEWMFHKSVDLSRSEIPAEHKDGILNKIAEDIITTLHETKAKNTEQTYEIIMVEGKVKESYNKCIDNLIKDNSITEDVGEKAKNLSNIDELYKQAMEEAIKKASKANK